MKAACPDATTLWTSAKADILIPMDEPPRIFFDTNEGSPSGYWLHLPKSKADLDALGNSLQEGLQVLIVMPDELEMFAVLRRDAEAKVWIAEPVRGTIRYFDGS